MSRGQPSNSGKGGGKGRSGKGPKGKGYRGRSRGGSGKQGSGRGSSKRAPAVTARRLSSGDAWVLVHPGCARERAEDIDEVRAMIDGGELEVAAEELQWLLSGCPDFVQAHVLLGEIAIALHNDLPLARGHFGVAYQLGEKAFAYSGAKGTAPANQPANWPWFAAARGLAWTLEKLGKPDTANQIVSAAMKWDPSDPLEIRNLMDELRSGGLPVVGLSLPMSKPDADENNSADEKTDETADERANEA